MTKTCKACGQPLTPRAELFAQRLAANEDYLAGQERLRQQFGVFRGSVLTLDGRDIECRNGIWYPEGSDQPVGWAPVAELDRMIDNLDGDADSR